MTSDQDGNSRSGASLGRPGPAVDPTESLIEDLDDDLPEIPAPHRQPLGTGQFEDNRAEATSVESPAAKALREAGQQRPKAPPTPGLSPPQEPRRRRTTSGRTDRPEERIGEVLGSYRLLEVIGKGGMGAVYKAEHIKLGRAVALKLLRPDYAERKDSVARFFQEARTVNRVRHRNIVEVTDLVELDNGLTFIIMELLTGYNFGKWARSGFQISRAIALFIQICDGLAAAHDVGIVHRDLKPDNIFVVPTMDGAEMIKILDFGVAKLLHREEEDYGLETAAGAVIGTPAFMSPEQAGGMDIDHRSDIYSLGAIIYETMCGQPMFRAKSFGEYVRKHLNESPTPPRQTQMGQLIDERLESVIMRCLAKKREDRFANVRELRAALFEQLGAMETDNFPLIGLSTDGNVLELLSESRSGSVQMPPYLTTGPHAPVPTLGQAGHAIPDLRPYTGRKRWIAVGAAVAGVVGLGYLIVQSSGEGTSTTAAKPNPAAAAAVVPPPKVEPMQVEPVDDPEPKTALTGSFVVRFESQPDAAKVYAENETEARCTTPCDVSIDQAGPGLRTYTLRKKGFVSAPIEIDVATPKDNVFVALDSEDAATPVRPTGIKPPRDPKTGDRPPKDTTAAGSTTSSGATGTAIADPPKDPKPPKDPRTGDKPPKDVKPTDTLDPFGN